MPKTKYLNECRLCGTHYPACSYCDSTKESNSWRKVACCWGHYLALQPMIKYDQKSLSKEEAKEEINSVIDLYGRFEVSSTMKKLYDDIMCDEAKPTIKKKQKIINANK